LLGLAVFPKATFLPKIYEFATAFKNWPFKKKIQGVFWQGLSLQ
jgi:hypothetical protein